MRILLAASVALLASQTLAQDAPWNCNAWADLPQQGMNYCAYQDWQKADAELNTLWPEVKRWARATDKYTREWRPQIAIAEESLLKAQRAWIDYRDGHCESEG
ncbi:MAG: lysozyme inhibitor LprI family protein, partial [Pseudomonadota bacterium]